MLSPALPVFAVVSATLLPAADAHPAGSHTFAYVP